MSELITEMFMAPDQQVAQLEGAGRVYSHAERMRVVFGILTCLMLAAIDQTVVLPAIPQMAASLRGAGQLSWVVSAYLLTATATTPIYGKLSDQLGRRAVLIPALVFFCVASVVCALSTSVLMLIFARALQGIGGGALLAVSQAAVADVIPPRERGKYQAWFTAVWTISSVAGPIAGGFVAQDLSWRWIFWFNVPLALLSIGFIARGLAGLKPAGRRSRIDYSGALLMIAAVAAALFGLSAGGVDAAVAVGRGAGRVRARRRAFLRCWRCSSGARRRRSFPPRCWPGRPSGGFWKSPSPIPPPCSGRFSCSR